MGLPKTVNRSQSVSKRSKKYLDEALYLMLFKDGGSEMSVKQQLNRFIKSSKRVYKWEVAYTIKKLRSRGPYYPALMVYPNTYFVSASASVKFLLDLLSETKCRRGMNKTVSDQAIHLDLIAKARGLPVAENYFVSLPENSKILLTYGALLNCYCKELMVEESEFLFAKMKELKFDITSMSYNSLMTLYSKMRALAAINDISGAERVVEEMKRDGRVAADWTTCSNLGAIYFDSGQFEKAKMALRESENKILHRDVSGFQFLITLYGLMGSLSLVEVY